MEKKVVLSGRADTIESAKRRENVGTGDVEPV
jgi:hypothetical protein